MFYCENCGAKLSDDALFCENCGTKVSPITTNNIGGTPDLSEDIFIFNKSDWRHLWRGNASDAFRAIILTNTSDCSDQQRERFYKSLKKYTDYRREYGNTDYFILDMESQHIIKTPMLTKPSSLEFILKVLKDVCAVRIPDYLFIVGDRDAVESISWNNPLHHSPSLNRDSDKTVDSDLPYVTLSTESPFNSVTFPYTLRVGRLPAQAKSGFEQAVEYFENTSAVVHDNVAKYAPHPLVLCAEEWQKCSHSIFYPNSDELYPCGPYTYISQSKMQILSNRTPHNLYCFNLHGSPTMDYWVNGDGCAAYSPQALPHRHGYVIGTEACYGAKPVIRKTTEQSILITALQNGCLGYLGSTQIAFGITDDFFSPGYQFSNADAMVGGFTKYVSEGYSLGESYVKSVKDILNSAKSNKLRGEECKTLASFALYGDPSLICFEYFSCYSASKSYEPKANQDTSIHIAMPDIITAVEAKITKVNQEISDTIDNFVRKTCPFFSDTKPAYFRLDGDNGYTVSYSKKQNNLTKIMNIYFDDSGNITDVFVTK